MHGNYPLRTRVQAHESNLGWGRDLSKSLPAKLAGRDLIRRRSPTETFLPLAYDVGYQPLRRRVQPKWPATQGNPQWAYHADLIGTIAWVILVVPFAESNCSPMRHLHTSTWVGPTRIRGVVTPQRSPGYSPAALLRHRTPYLHSSQIHSAPYKYIQSKFTKALIRFLAF